MCTVGNILADMNHIPNWITVQVNAGISKEEVVATQYEALYNKISLVKFSDFSSGATLSSRITESDFGLTSTQKQELCKLICKIGVSSGGPVVSRDNQECDAFELYFDEDESAKLLSKKYSDTVLINICKSRAKAIGLLLPSETTKGRIANIVKNAVVGTANMPPLEWYKLLQKVKAALAPLAKVTWNFAVVRTYPDDPNSLPTEIFAHAYPVRPPALMPVPGMEPPLFLRKNSKHMQSQTQVVVAPQASNAFDPSGFVSMFGAHMKCMFDPLLQMQREALGSRQSSRESMTPPREASPHQSEQAAVPTPLALKDEQPNIPNSIGDDDEVLRKAMAAKAAAKHDAEPNQTRKGKGKGRGTKPVIRHRPAAAVMLKPAAAVIKKPAANIAGRPAAPRGSLGNNPPRVDYKGARIYTDCRQGQYRVILDIEQSRSDRSFGFKSYGNCDSAWSAALQYVEENRR